MSYSIRLDKIILKNFIGIKSGLGRKELNLDLTKLKDKRIICILGENGTGKTTLSSTMHPLPGTTDKRSKFIIEGEEGLKKLFYTRNDGIKFECKIVYSPSKTGHTAKGFIKKISQDGEKIELNPNGNISSYKEVIFEELGVSDAILKLANQNDVCKGHVDMTSTERKVNMATFLPEDLYSNYYNTVDKIYKEMKTRINVLVDAIGKMHDEDTLKLNLEKVTNKINDLVSKRDKTIGKIKEFETRINIYDKENIKELEHDLSKELKHLDKDREKILIKIKDTYQYIINSTNTLNDRKNWIDNIDDTLDFVQSKLSEINMQQALLINNIKDLQESRSNIFDNIEKKELILKDINTNYSLNELKSLLKDYNKRFKELDSIISDIDNGLTKSDFMVGYDVIKVIRDSIDSISEHDVDIIQEVIKQHKEYNADALSIYSIKLAELYDSKKELENDKDALYNTICSLNENSNLKEILDKRPKSCQIDDCPFIVNAQKWTLIEEKINQNTEAIDKIDKKLDSLNTKISMYEEFVTISNKINSTRKFILVNNSILSKLPYNEEYITFDALLNSISKRGSNLSNCDNFDKYIEALEFKDEYNELKYKKIPSIENEIKIIETQGKIIDDSKEDLEILKRNYEDIKEKLSNKINEKEKMSNKIKEYDILIDNLTILQDLTSKLKSTNEDIIATSDKLKDISDKLDKYIQYKEKILDKKHKLKDIENELQPLTRERELYKMEQLKIADHKQELSQIESQMFKCEIVRASLSVKDNGIPVGALEYFMDSVRTNANALLSNAFNGALYLEEFIINSKDFIIPYKKNGDKGIDVSFASSSERSFISLCLTLSIMEEVVSNYGIAILDEIDRGFSDGSKMKFIEILGSQVKRAGISQVFMVTHNSSFYEGYDIGYILFPKSAISKKYEDSTIEI